MADDPSPFAPTPLFAFPLFRTVVGEHDRHRAGLLAAIDDARSTDVGVTRSVRGGGWHSGPAFLQRRDPDLGWVLQTVHQFAEQALASRYDGWKSTTLRLGSYWANVLPPGAWNAPHHHHPQHWSAVYYVQVPALGDADDPAGWLEFLNPSPVQSQWGAGSYALGPREGLIVLFPSSLVHLVHPAPHADADRVSLALNFDVVPRR